MKTLITYLFIFFCVFSNAQDYSLIDKSYELSEELLKLEKEKNYRLYRELSQLKAQIKDLTVQVNVLKEKASENSNLKDILSALEIKPVKQDDLPNKLQKDEIGVAFVASEDNSVSLAVFIDNQWKIISL
jgi:regulator of replication initiation timing|tara:strand:+ start:37042 stop:37431 length:390 start_codon:yes stop_codon:yes gene_type:complete